MTPGLAELLRPSSTGNVLADRMIGHLQEDLSRGYFERPEYVICLCYGLLDYVSGCRNSLHSLPASPTADPEALSREAELLTESLLRWGANELRPRRSFAYDLANVAVHCPPLTAELLKKKDGGSLDVLEAYAWKLFGFAPEGSSSRAPRAHLFIVPPPQPE